MTDDSKVYDFLAESGKRGLHIDELVKLPPEERTRKRLAETAERLDLSMTELRAAIRERSKQNGGEAKGRPVELKEFEPWSEPVDGGQVLEAAAEAVKARVLLPDHEADLIPLWVAHCHLFDAFDHTPRLMVTAPEQECGKSLLMSHVIGPMVPRAMFVELMKPAPFFRLAEEFSATFLIDEVDVFIKEDSDLLAALNAGFEPHGGVPRCVGDDNEVRLFRPHCPVVVAGIDLVKKLPPSTISRCIVLALNRATSDELQQLTPVRRDDPELHVIGRQLSTWTNEQEAAIRDAPRHSERGRTADKWAPLFQIAAVAGGDWLDRCRTAYDRLKVEDTPNPTRAHELLRDIRNAFGREPKIWTSTLIERLCGDREKPWNEYNFMDRNDRRIRDKQIAKLLEPYRVKSKNVRIRDTVLKGYYRQDFEEVFSRYLPPRAATPLQRSTDAAFSDSASATRTGAVADEKEEERVNQAGCSAVADSSTPPGKNECPTSSGEGSYELGEDPEEAVL